MPTMAEKFWEMGRTPAQQLMFILFGLAALLTAVIARAILSYALVTGSSVSAVGFVAAVLGGVGGFFVTLGLFIGAYSSPNGAAWKIAQLIGAVIILLFLL